jgi:hypothetical protein
MWRSSPEDLWPSFQALPTLRFRRLRGDMIETYKIFNKIYDERVTSTLFILNSSNITYRLDNYESNLTTGEEIEIDEEKKLSIVVDSQCSETDL